jgi:hypothetical protein
MIAAINEAILLRIIDITGRSLIWFSINEKSNFFLCLFSDKNK